MVRVERSALQLARLSLAREAYVRRDRRDVDAAHPLGADCEEPLSRRGGVSDQHLDVDALTAWRESAETLDPFLQQRRRTVEVAVAPVMKAHADLEDAVVEASDRRACVAPQELERLVLLEELAGVELLDAMDQLWRRWVVAADARGLVDRTTWDALWRPRRLAVAATRCGRARRRRSSGSAVHLRETRERAGSRMLSVDRPVGPRTRP